ncbi:Hypoxic response protein 1 (plasmid) [Sulfitobacter indolifex]|uniref:HPP family/CBS domain protein n=1 Tax=Sulfitobacter indolifex HEL-45 TaxID=391624 RepID=A0ABP2D4M6_9RHOB|nr:HPP family protein [Sulfitobacter indolifex]EDQ03197.1 HPP family/CBS domain protein [Sulfitobacter indolifex HEL-45]UOA20752.1 Hypoxic response protein 1 [Sulfitobacter indolifex]
MRIRHHLEPALPRFHGGEPLRAGLGALIGISVCVGLAYLGALFGQTSFYLVAPLGATAVLLFCVPNSPLAQPWSAVMGNISAALVALITVWYIPGAWSVGIAVGGAITVMMFLRALHPPGGAVALLTALNPEVALAAGPWFALVPLGLATVVLVLCATVYNRLTGRKYPFRLPKEEPDDAPPRLGLSTDKISELLERYNQTTNLGVADLGRLLAAAEAEAAQHRFDGTTCADIMTSDLITVCPKTSLKEAARLLRKHRIKSLPVVDAGDSLRGVIFQADLLDVIFAQGRPLARKQQARQTAEDVMHSANRAVPHDLPVGVLLNRLAEQGSDVIPVVRGTQLVGILTRTDIMRLLLQGADERAVA